MTRIALNITVMLMLAACASGPELKPAMRTWSETAKKSDSLGSTLISKSSTDTPAVRGLAQKNPTHATSTQFGESMGASIDRTLAHFVSHRSDSHTSKAEIPPPLILAQWKQTLEQLEDALAWMPNKKDVGSLVRARTTLEVEMERDRERFASMPHELTVAYIQVIENIDRRMQEVHALSPSRRRQHLSTEQVEELVLEWPLRAFAPSSPFGYRRDPFDGRLRFHAGIDLSTSPLTPVHAAADGVVVFADWSGGYGQYVVIEHKSGVRSHYAHLAHLYVSEGTAVRARDPVGAVGSTGRSTGPHLHFSVSVFGNYVDPVLYINTPIRSDGSVPTS